MWSTRPPPSRWQLLRGGIAPQNVFVSVDDGRRWFQMTPMPRSDQMITQLIPLSGPTLAVLYVVPSGKLIANLEANPALIGGLDDVDAGTRAATARALGLSHNPSLLPVLMNHLRDPDAFAGEQVARAIGTIGDRSVSADLLNLLMTAPAVERTRAALALGMLKSEDAVPGWPRCSAPATPRPNGWQPRRWRPSVRLRPSARW